MVYDCARLGEGSHSHYDLFSFCLHADGQPAVIDPGRYTYSSAVGDDGVDWRHAFKATSAHNTITIDGADQTRYLSRTKHGPEVSVERARWHLGERSDWVVASARSVEYSPVHTRVLVFLLRQYLLVVDVVTVDDGARHTAELRFHLSEGEPSLHRDGQQVRLVGGPVQLLTALPAGAVATLEQGWISLEYGVKAPAPVVTVSQSGDCDLVFASVVGPRRTHGGTLLLKALHRLGHNGFRVEGTLDGEPFEDTVWTSDGTLAVDDVTIDGRFAVVRRVAGEVTHLAGEDVRRGTDRPVQEWTRPLS